MSGLWLAERRESIVIEEVGTASPAADVGLRRGDILEGDGTLAQWISRLGGSPGDMMTSVIGEVMRLALSGWCSHISGFCMSVCQSAQR